MWIKIIQSKVFASAQSKGRERLKKTYDYTSKKKFDSVNFTTSSKTLTNPKFPTVYLKKLQGQPRGRTLEDTKVNAILTTFQIEVYTNTNDTDAGIIADAMADIMIEMGFDMIGEPYADNSENVYRNVSRWQRLIGFGDKLNF